MFFLLGLTISALPLPVINPSINVRRGLQCPALHLRWQVFPGAHSFDHALRQISFDWLLCVICNGQLMMIAFLRIRCRFHNSSSTERFGNCQCTLSWCHGVGQTRFVIVVQTCVIFCMVPSVGRVAASPKHPSQRREGTHEGILPVAAAPLLLWSGTCELLHFLTLLFVLFLEAFVNDCEKHVRQHVPEQYHKGVREDGTGGPPSHSQLGVIKGPKEHLEACDDAVDHGREVACALPEQLISHHDIPHENDKHHDDEVENVLETSSERLEHHAHPRKDLQVFEEPKEYDDSVDCTEADEPAKAPASPKEVMQHCRITLPDGTGVQGIPLGPLREVEIPELHEDHIVPQHHCDDGHDA
mmetsp:Transcript_42396/g.98191  ORF Transcript_42396/g.98191 Transcript_42396/m.98191 type:complete len:357 (-) Transcript_42396:1052-2122(-)